MILGNILGKECRVNVLWRLTSTLHVRLMGTYLARGVSIYLARSTEIHLAYGPKDDQGEIARPHEGTLTLAMVFNVYFLRLK